MELPHDPAAAALEAPSAPALPGRARVLFALVLFCFLLSGFAALLYQTAWMRQFSVVFGTSDLAVAAVLASYMAGLALGAAIAGKFLLRVRRPILVYGICELVIALSALAVPYALELARAALGLALGGQSELSDSMGLGASLYYLASAFLVLLVPTTAMGATLPLLARHAVRRDDEVGRRIGWLYATNTLGAVLGAVIAAFALLPALGLARTVQVGAATNLAVFAVAALAAGLAGRSPAAAPAPRRAAFGWPLPFMLASGFASFTYEVLWTRLLVHVVGASVYAFATMLATFLAGIAIGSALAAPLARSRRAAALGLAWSELGVAAFSCATWLALGRLPGWAAQLGAGEYQGVLGNAALAALVLLPSTLCIGATFPFALRALARDEHDAAAAAARVYAWNTVGAIAGAVLAGFWIVPALEYAGSVRLAVALNLALACGAVFAGGPRARAARLGVLAPAALLLAGFWPKEPLELLQQSPVAAPHAVEPVIYYGVGRSATVLMLDRDGALLLQAGGLPQGEVARHGAVPFRRHFYRWLTALPILARPEADALLVIGLGGGACAEGVPAHIKTIDAIELEEEVLAADRAISGMRLDDPLADPRVRVVVNDARGALSLTTKRWDLIVSQPSHPWTAGASHLFTKEFLELAHAHLEPGGVFVQWISTTFIDADLFKTVGATLLDEFAHVRLYRPLETGLLIALASDEPLEIERQWAADPSAYARIAKRYQVIGLNDVNDLAACLALDSAGLAALCAGAPVSTDDDNRVALQPPGGARQALGGEGLDRLLLPHDPLLDPASELSQALGPALDRVYLARRMARMQLVQRAKQLAERTTDKAVARMAGAQLMQTLGRGVEAQQLVLEALSFDAREPHARWSRVEPYAGLLASGAAPPEVVSAAAALPRAQADVLAGLRAGTNGQWDAVEQMDDALAAVATTDPAFPFAARLRAEWRARAGFARPPAVCRRLGEEALAILDRSIALGYEPVDLVLRADAAQTAGRADVLVETAAELLHFVGPGAPPFPEPLGAEVVRVLAQTRGLMDKAALDPRLDPARAAVVAEALERALSELAR